MHRLKAGSVKGPWCDDLRCGGECERWGAMTEVAASRNVGSQTLARGLRALEFVASAQEGLTVQDVADRLEVHRTIAHRLLATLAEHRLVNRGPDGRFRAGVGLMALAQGVQGTLRET